MKKAAILIGHRKGAQGAYSEFLLATEFEFNSIIIAKRLKDYADIYFRPDTHGVSEVSRIKEVLIDINKQDYDIVIELHFNSSSNESANGCQALFYHSNEKGKELAQFFINQMNLRVGIKKRSLIPIKSTNQRGGTFIIKNKSTAILLEPFFGSNYDDCQKIAAHIEDYCQIIKDIINRA